VECAKPSENFQNTKGHYFGAVDPAHVRNSPRMHFITSRASGKAEAGETIQEKTEPFEKDED
jgi:hypothetical protein